MVHYKFFSEVIILLRSRQSRCDRIDSWYWRFCTSSLHVQMHSSTKGLLLSTAPRTRFRPAWGVVSSTFLTMLSNSLSVIPEYAMGLKVPVYQIHGGFYEVFWRKHRACNLEAISVHENPKRRRSFTASRGRRCSWLSKRSTQFDVLLSLPFQNHPQRYEKLVSYYSDTAIGQRKIRWLERDLNQSRSPSMPVRRLGVGIALEKSNWFTLNFQREFYACSAIVTKYKQSI
jgi:hypothetical protein